MIVRSILVVKLCLFLFFFPPPTLAAQSLHYFFSNILSKKTTTTTQTSLPPTSISIDQENPLSESPTHSSPIVIATSSPLVSEESNETTSYKVSRGLSFEILENYRLTPRDEEEKSLSASTQASGNFLTTSNAAIPSSSPRPLSFRKNLSEMKRLIQRSKPGEESKSSPRNFSPIPSSTENALNSSSNPSLLVTSGGSLVGRPGTKSLTNSSPIIPQVNHPQFTLPLIKITPSAPNNQRDVSEDSTEISENYYFFSRIRFPITLQEELLIKDNFAEGITNERLLSEEAVKTLQLRYSQSVFVKKELDESTRVNVVEEYTPRGCFGAPSGHFLTARALLSLPVSEEKLLEVINHQVLPSYGMIYSRISSTMANARNVHMIEAVSPVLIHSNQNYPMSEQVVPQYLSVITKAGFILTFKRIAPANTYPRPSPPWMLVEEPELLFGVTTNSNANTLKSSSNSSSSPSEEKRRNSAAAKKSTTVAEPSIVIEIVQSELSLLVLPNYLHITSRYAQNIIARYLYPHHYTQSRNEPHVVHTLDPVLAATYEHTLHVNPKETPKILWWTRSTGSPYLNDFEACAGFCKLLPNGTPRFEITGIGRGDLFQYIFSPLNAQVTESGPFFNPLFISQDAYFYNPQRELQELKEEMVKNWRLCAERMQPPACQVARSLASLYIYRLVKLLAVPINDITLYISERHLDSFEENRREAIRRLNQLAVINNISYHWSTEDDIPKLFYIYNKLASIPVNMEPLTSPPPQNETASSTILNNEAKLTASDENESEAQLRLTSIPDDASMVGSISYTALASYFNANPHVFDDSEEDNND